MIFKKYIIIIRWYLNGYYSMIFNQCYYKISILLRKFYPLIFITTAGYFLGLLFKFKPILILTARQWGMVKQTDTFKSSCKDTKTILWDKQINHHFNMSLHFVSIGLTWDNLDTWWTRPGKNRFEAFKTGMLNLNPRFREK